MAKQSDGSSIVWAFKTNVTCKNGLTWSDDNRIAMCADDGVFIIELTTNFHLLRGTLLARRTIISPHSDIFYSTEIFNLEELENRLPREEFNSILIDRTISPTVQYSIPPQGYKSANWSPKGADDVGRCVLACLAIDHRLTICREDRYRSVWIKVIDCSKVYEDIWKKNNSSYLKGQEINFEYLKTISYALAAVAMAWSNTYETFPAIIHPDDRNLLMQSSTEKSKYSIFASAMKNGDVVFWKVHFPIICSGDCVYLTTASIHDSIPTSMSWCPSQEDMILAVGYSDGMIKVIRFNLTCGIVSDSEDVWADPDLISVNALSWQCLDIHQDQWLLFASKDLFIMAFVLDRAKLTCIQMVHIRGQYNLSCTGMSSRSGTLALSASDEKVQLIKATMKDEELKLDSKLFPITIDCPVFALQYIGVALSPNASLLAVVACPACPFDQKQLKEPLMLCVSRLSLWPEYPDILQLSEHRGIRDIHDVLLLYLWGLMNDKPLIAPSVLHLLTDMDSWPGLSLTQLRMIRCLLSLDKNTRKLIIMGEHSFDLHGQSSQPSLSSSSSSFASNNKESLKYLHTLLMFKFIQPYIVNTLIPRITELDNLELRIISSICQWLNARMYHFSRWDSIAAAVKKMLSSIEHSIIIFEEDCPICGELLEDVDVMSVACSGNHTFGRCCKSLLPCKEIPYRRCSLCSSVAMPISVTTDAAGLCTIDPHSCTFCEDSLCGSRYLV
ncbi:general transcription factor 3C polypeptide 4 isoform X1 [Octopus bimaculoides]|uniref:Transcription factor IIIC 90kDa subunit N-terminal domain-containing protein n=1 Tax=Octopus bimaculoides TaxID=37653 RepID=A0A0L8FKW9_OCTBM|nr:general transcription factor 3C polypeptide 4 isoform X1 [Octopus bimaculoides]|eukprot:XP_014788911.1 PREDICTED: general transcription factor 3C polypeptide 4-like [Octopus bimaculoides]